MCTFATIIDFYSFKEVSFYTIMMEGDDKSLGSQFIDSNRTHKHINILRAWIQNIGNKRGAKSYLFRPEGKADALPPPIEVTQRECSLRWYCLRMNENVIILFNGGEKTKGIRLAQDCPNVRPHFELANKLSEAIWEAFANYEFDFDDRNRLNKKNIKFQIQ
ncbi:MAG: hypothetical protein IT265_05760 [Saprospiraceae bacterium]|nr:hypothetical protein [Saprospiraceae bacterium]